MTTTTTQQPIDAQELSVSVLRGVRAMAVAYDDMTTAVTAADAAEASERFDLIVRATIELV